VNTPQIPISEAARHALPSALIHDLRTPLNQIIGYSELLMEQAQEQGQAHFVPDLQKTQTAGRQLLAIINDHFHSLCVPGTPETIAPSREEHANPAEEEQNAEVIAEYPRAGEPASDTAQGYVLVVDDVEANRDVLSRRLQRQGYAVATADDGRQALEKLSADTFDLVLLDIMMPEMDG